MKQIEVKSTLNKQKRRDDWFLTDYSVNPYSGCTFNCTYCYIRGSKYGENMAKTFSVKSNTVELLNRQLKRRAEKKEHGFIALASATEPYLPIEQKLQVTKQMLEIILKYHFPVAIGTKSPLVLRDLQLAKHYPQLLQKYKNLYRIFFSPPKDYTSRIEATARALCKHYGVRYRIS